MIKAEKKKAKAKKRAEAKKTAVAAQKAEAEATATRVELGVQRPTRRALFNIHEELEGFSEEELQRFGEQIFMAKTANGPDSSVIEGKIFSHRKSNKIELLKCYSQIILFLFYFYFCFW